MRTVGSRELKNRLGRYLGMVRRGETILVTDRGKPVACLAPTESNRSKQSSVMDVLRRLEAEGQLKLGTRPFRPFKPVRTKGKPASQMILEDRA
jgi:prevent-host-death family protein